MSSMLSTRILIDGGKAGHDLIRLFPDTLQTALDSFDIGFIDASGLMSPFGILIQVVAASSKERYQFRNIGEVQPDHIAVNGHFSDVGPHVFCPQLAHLFFNQRLFTLVDHDNNGDLTLSICQIITSSSTHHPSAADALL